ncbi:MAG: hypothetical protein QF429_00730 [Candidatus Nitrosopelagicus sp.]|jgi:hypothetical protein|nr:hypothetical protein [Candidatus Nitrosopelagicus sp.]
MFGRKKGEVKEGDFVFTSRKDDGDYNNFIFGTVTGVDGNKIGVNGFFVNPVGLKNKVSQGKAGPRSKEILLSPTSENCILALIYRIEYENFSEVLDIESDKVEFIPKRTFTVFDGWIRESLSELINNVLSLPAGSEQDHAKRILKQKMENLYDKDLKKNLYSVCRSLKILI